MKTLEKNFDDTTVRDGVADPTQSEDDRPDSPMGDGDEPTTEEPMGDGDEEDDDTMEAD